MSKSWSSLLLVVAAAVIAVAAVDLAGRRIVPPVNRREVEDGIKDLKAANPDILVLGSSHARTLHVLGQELSRRTHGERALVAIPVENGKVSVYRWTLQHRIAPLVEEVDSRGAPVRHRIREFMLIIEWWDSCAPQGSNRFPFWNLPARAWAFPDFVADVSDSGLNGYNRNYLQNRFRRTFADSALVFNRTDQTLVQRSMDWLNGRAIEPTPEEIRQQTSFWQQSVEKGATCIGSPTQMEALRDVINYAQQRGWSTTVLLFPRKPSTLTAKAKQTTLPQFAALVRNMFGPEVRVVDLTSTTPLTDADFMADFDHVNAAGNDKFARWALDHDLGFLQSSPRESSARLVH